MYVFCMCDGCFLSGSDKMDETFGLNLWVGKLHEQELSKPRLR